MTSKDVPPWTLELLTPDDFKQYLIDNGLCVGIVRHDPLTSVVVCDVVRSYDMIGGSASIAWRDAVAAFATSGNVLDFATVTPALTSAAVSYEDAQAGRFVFDGIAFGWDAGGSAERITICYKALASSAPAVTLGVAESIGDPITGSFSMKPISCAYVQPSTNESLPIGPPVAYVFTASDSIAIGTVLPAYMLGASASAGAAPADGSDPAISTSVATRVDLGTTTCVVHFDMQSHVFVLGPPPP